MKIVLKNTPEQQELILEVIKENQIAIDAFKTIAEPIYNQIIKDKKLD